MPERKRPWKGVWGSAAITGTPPPRHWRVECWAECGPAAQKPSKAMSCSTPRCACPGWAHRGSKGTTAEVLLPPPLRPAPCPLHKRRVCWGCVGTVRGSHLAALFCEHQPPSLHPCAQVREAQTLSPQRKGCPRKRYGFRTSPQRQHGSRQVD